MGVMLALLVLVIWADYLYFNINVISVMVSVDGCHAGIVSARHLGRLPVF